MIKTDVKIKNSSRWGWISRILLAIISILLIPLSWGDPVKILFTGAMIVIALVSLAIEAILYYTQLRNNIASAFSLFLIIIYATIFLGGACFIFWPDWLPYLAFGSLIFGYLITVIWFSIYINKHQETHQEGQNFLENLKNFGHDTHLGSWDILKGLGGVTFSEFAGGVGVLVSIGIYLVITPDDLSIQRGFWLAAQLAALISLLSAAAWVQRYVLEKPEYPALKVVESATTGHRFLKTGPNFLNSIAALLTMLAIVVTIPPQGIGGYWWISAGWIAVIGIWGLATLVLSIKIKNADSWPKNPPNSPGWGSRVTIKFFLWLTFIIILLAAIGMAIAWLSFRYWDNLETQSKVYAGFAAWFFVLGIVWKWVVDKFEEEKDSELKMMMIFRDIALLFCGGVILWVQISPPGDPNDPLSTLYKFTLGIMAYATVLGILIGAYKWSTKRGDQSGLPATDPEIEMVANYPTYH